MKKSTINFTCISIIVIISTIIANEAYRLKDRFVIIARMLPNGNMDYTPEFTIGFYVCMAVYVLYSIIAGLAIVSYVLDSWKRSNLMNYNLDEAKI